MKPIYSPSHQDVDLALKALEIEDEREKEVIRRFYAREHRAFQVSHLAVWLGLLAFCGAVWGFVIAWVYPAIHRLLAKVF